MSDKILEFARKATKLEVENFYNFIRSKQDEKLLTAQNTLELHGASLINAYHEFAHHIENEIGKQNTEIAIAKKCFAEQRCLCGLKLKEFTNRYNGQVFMGCPDYLNEEKVHKAWNYNPVSGNQYLFKSWLSDIIYKLDLKGKLHTKYLLFFYEENGLKDIQFEYTGVSSYDLIDRYTNINKSQKAFELRQVEFLRNQWPNVIYQFPVKYKYRDDKEKFCFIDILCSNDETICIYECKSNRYSIDNKQMNLYIDVIKHINTSLKINKKLIIDYITEE